MNTEPTTHEHIRALAAAVRDGERHPSNGMSVTLLDSPLPGARWRPRPAPRGVPGCGCPHAAAAAVPHRDLPRGYPWVIQSSLKRNCEASRS
jgi:hypothetical protein